MQRVKIQGLVLAFAFILNADELIWLSKCCLSPPQPIADVQDSCTVYQTDPGKAMDYIDRQREREREIKRDRAIDRLILLLDLVVLL